MDLAKFDWEAAQRLIEYLKNNEGGYFYITLLQNVDLQSIPSGYPMLRTSAVFGRTDKTPHDQLVVSSWEEYKNV
jgi:hypothetical protein